MHEDSNWKAYHQEVKQKLDSNSPFIPFLGVFLTTTAFHQTASQTRANSVLSLGAGKEKASAAAAVENTKMYETYHLLEAITVRERLSKLREDSFAQDPGG